MCGGLLHLMRQHAGGRREGWVINAMRRLASSRQPSHPLDHIHKLVKGACRGGACL